MSSPTNPPECPDISKQEKRKKQVYLKDNIMSMGYDPDDFANFLENEKEGGIDIENWTLEELETVVQIFRKTRDRLMEEEGVDYGENYSPNGPDFLGGKSPSKTSKSDKLSDPKSAILSKFPVYCKFILNTDCS